jgi:hypothetical protein
MGILKAYNHIPKNMRDAKKPGNFQTQNVKHFSTALLKVNFKMFFLKYFEIKYGLHTQNLCSEKNWFRMPKIVLTVRALMGLRPLYYDQHLSYLSNVQACTVLFIRKISVIFCHTKIYA